jgi:hypothetical protein
MWRGCRAGPQPQPPGQGWAAGSSKLGCLALAIVQASAYVRETSYSFGDYLGLYHRQKMTYLRTSLSMLRPTIARQCTQHSGYRWIRSSRCIILPRSTRSRYFTCYTFTTTSRYRCGCFTTPGRTRTERRAGLIL